MHPSAIIAGYELALEKTKEILKKCVNTDIQEMSEDKVLKVLESNLASKIP